MHSTNPPGLFTCTFLLFCLQMLPGFLSLNTDIHLPHLFSCDSSFYFPQAFRTQRPVFTAPVFSPPSHASVDRISCLHGSLQGPVPSGDLIPGILQGVCLPLDSLHLPVPAPGCKSLKFLRPPLIPSVPHPTPTQFQRDGVQGRHMLKPSPTLRGSFQAWKEIKE